MNAFHAVAKFTLRSTKLSKGGCKVRKILCQLIFKVGELGDGKGGDFD